jgi:CheY-like chemotaxis protein
LARILVVDDRADAIEILTRMLWHLGHDAHGVRDGLTALDLVPRLAPDLVIVDIMMPRIDGCEVIARLREIHSTLPVIAISAGDSDVLLQLQMFGVHEFLIKPTRMAELAGAVQRALARPAIQGEALASSTLLSSFGPGAYSQRERRGANRAR